MHNNVQPPVDTPELLNKSKGKHTFTNDILFIDIWDLNVNRALDLTLYMRYNFVISIVIIMSQNNGNIYDLAECNICLRSEIITSPTFEEKR